VADGATELTVTFPRPEADVRYALHAQPSWFTAAIVEKTPTGFTVRFEKPAPAGATLDWILIR